MHSKMVLAVANWVAAAGAFVIRLFGGEAKVSGNILRTASGGFVVTQECIMTPLIPAYFAAVFALSLTWRQRAVSLLLAFPVFFVLGAARLLVLAFPTRVVGSHLVAIHGFYQFLLAAFLVGMAATFSASHRRSVRALLKPVATALVAGGLTAYLVGLTYNRLLFWLVDRLQAGLLHSDHSYQDPQGALLIMAPYQLGPLRWTLGCVARADTLAPRSGRPRHLADDTASGCYPGSRMGYHTHNRAPRGSHQSLVRDRRSAYRCLDRQTSSQHRCPAHFVAYGASAWLIP